MDWTHGQNERREITENSCDKQTRRLQKTRKTAVRMGRLCEERSKKRQRRKKSGEKMPTTGSNGEKRK